MIRAALARWLPAGSFARNVGVLTGGTAFAQGLAVLALPLLTRLYSPEDFALLAVYVAIIGIATVVSCLRYNIAIPLPEDDADGMALLAVALIAATVISGLLAVPVLLAPARTAALLGQPGLAPYLWMVPLGVFLASAYNALQYWASRNKRFGLVTRTRMTRAVGGIGTQAAIGAAAPSPLGLLFGHMLYGGLGVIGLARDLWRRDRPILRRTDGARIVGIASVFRRFPMWSVPEALFNTAGVQVPVILIAAAAAGPEAGFLMLAMRVMGLPMGLVGSSVSQVFLAEAPARLRDGTLAAFTRSTMWTLFRTGAPPLVAVGALSPLLFPLVFGAEWARAGWLVAWMTPWFVLQFVASPVSMVLHVTGRVALAMGLQALGLLLRVGPVLAVATVAPDRLSEVYALTGAVFYGGYLWAVGVTAK
ncbi:lipopolysaccharide biosynthesis protein [Roseovarius ramblicola]|uniref:Lipopolysaccharide biosynthesis protein n=1 Tax=Roseovarius ramblicola TaxID=2022336 RepID=A0ABV5HZU6_9RHOB